MAITAHATVTRLVFFPWNGIKLELIKLIKKFKTTYNSYKSLKGAIFGAFT
jgi:hypothetical protein